MEDEEEDDIPVLAAKWEKKPMSGSIEEQFLLSHTLLVRTNDLLFLVLYFFSFIHTNALGIDNIFQHVILFFVCFFRVAYPMMFLKNLNSRLKSEVNS